MRFLANENFPLASVRRLRETGHAVFAVIEDSPGAGDPQVLSRAAGEDLTLLTFDRDYGELIYRKKAPSPRAVIYFPFDPLTPEEPANQLLRLLGVRAVTLEGRFTILERGRVRQRSLP